MTKTAPLTAAQPVAPSSRHLLLIWMLGCAGSSWLRYGVVHPRSC